MCRRKSKKDLLHERMSGFVLKAGQLMRGWRCKCIMGWCGTAVATNDLVSGQNSDKSSGQSSEFREQTLESLPDRIRR